MRFGAAAYEAAEGGDPAKVTVTLSQKATGELEIPIMVTPQGETVAADYQVDGLDAGTLTFDNGERTKTFTITAEEDDDFDDETVTLR